ncbi:ABC transporter ATP-binding protein [Leucobacter chromiireducens]|uniref:ABC transporter ATP-binding protein n=1 Tax=Leucobacter chromiireducens TaxID=283877 RepID=UPI003F7F6066
MRPAIVFNEVVKSFKINHTHSLKESFLAAIRRKDLSSSFRAVDGVNFAVPEGQSIALLGRNGSGKSTTLKLLSGVMRPDSGWIRTRGRVAGLLEVGAGFHPDLTGRENVYLNAAILGMSREETEARFNDILAFSEIGDFIDTEVKRYSSGMYARLGFSVAVHTELDVLLVDEILSVGDAQFRKKCDEKMLELREQGKTMFIVSHNASQVKRLCERGIVLDRGEVIFDGPIEEAVDTMNARLVTELPYPVLGSIRDVYDQNPGFGKPVGPAVQISESEGSSYQEFSSGIITTFRGSDGEARTFGLGKGIFLAAYRRNGGPAGPWGCLDGVPQGSLEQYEERRLPFQHGVASNHIERGLRFEAHDSHM